jgi:hypothetical protein
MCGIKHKLLETLSIAARRHAAAAANLAAACVSQTGFIHEFEAVEETLHGSEAALSALREHIDQHRCCIVR